MPNPSARHSNGSKPSHGAQVRDIGRLCLSLGLNARDHDLAVLAAEVDPLDTRTFSLPDLVKAMAELQVNAAAAAPAPAAAAR